ncbi:hypothetical protein ASG33_19225 [Dyadobacter sp. Leaf189]|nr:hypothetical protein ASG33_19225 [Dyadobacter sp. Leaf189]
MREIVRNKFHRPVFLTFFSDKGYTSRIQVFGSCIFFQIFFQPTAMQQMHLFEIWQTIGLPGKHLQ